MRKNLAPSKCDVPGDFRGRVVANPTKLVQRSVESVEIVLAGGEATAQDSLRDIVAALRPLIAGGSYTGCRRVGTGCRPR